MSNVEISGMILCDNSVDWSKTIKYLGVHLQSGKALKFDISPTKRACFAACNSIFMHGSVLM